MRYVLLLLLLAGCAPPQPISEQDAAYHRAMAEMFGAVPKFHSAQCLTVNGITSCQGW